MKSVGYCKGTYFHVLVRLLGLLGPLESLCLATWERTPRHLDRLFHVLCAFPKVYSEERADLPACESFLSVCDVHETAAQYCAISRTRKSSTHMRKDVTHIVDIVL